MLSRSRLFAPFILFFLAFAFSHESALSLSITTDPINGGPFCPGDTVKIKFLKHNGDFNADNIFTAQLSDEFGSFTSPVEIGDTVTSVTETILWVIPQGFTAGTSYKIRVNGSSPATTGSPSTNSFTILQETQIISNPVGGLVCEGDQVTLTVSATGSNLTYQWKKENTPISGATNFSYSITTDLSDAGSYTVVVAGDCGSITSTLAILIVNLATQIVYFSSDTETCEGEDVLFSVVALGSNLHYYWKKNGTIDIGTDISSLSVNSVTSADDADYSVIVSGDCGEDSSLLSHLTVHPVPIANAGLDTSICPGDSVLIGTSASGNDYSWLPTLGLDNSSVAQPFAFPSVSTTYTLTVTNSFNCSATSNITVTVNPPAFAISGNDTSICSGDSVTIGGNEINGYTYLWSPSEGLSSSTVFQPLTSPDITTTYTLIVTNTFGCMDTGEVTIVVNPLPTPDAGSDIAICIGSSATIGSNPTLGHQYLWLPNANLFPSNTVAEPEASPSITTTYTLTEIISSTGCKDIDVITITVTDTPTIQATNLQSHICSGQPTNILLSSDLNTIFQWSRNNTNVNGDFSGTLNGTSATISVVLTSTTIDSVIFTIIPETAGGCIGNTTYVKVIIIPTPATPQFSLSAPHVCVNEHGVNFSVTTIPGITYEWNTSPGELLIYGSTNSNCVINFPGYTGNVSVWITATDPSTNCYSTSWMNVTVGPDVAPDPCEVVLYAGNTLVALDNTVSFYQWGYDDRITLDTNYLVGQNSQDYLAGTSLDTANKYYWVITGNGNCFTKSYYNPPPASQTTNADNIELSSSEIDIYPNPNNGHFNIHFQNNLKGEMIMRITDITGRTIYITSILKITGEINEELHLLELPPGIYFLQTQINNSFMIPKKFIRE